MNQEQRAKCHTIIHSSACLAASVGAGLAQLPCSDNVAIVSVQSAMVLSLGSIFGIRLQQSTAESTLGAATATLLGRSLSQILVGWIPVFGNVCNALTAGAVTETVGWAVASDFASRSPAKNNKGSGKSENNSKGK